MTCALRRPHYGLQVECLTFLNSRRNRNLVHSNRFEWWTDKLSCASRNSAKTVEGSEKFSRQNRWRSTDIAECALGDPRLARTGNLTFLHSFLTSCTTYLTQYKEQEEGTVTDSMEYRPTWESNSGIAREGTVRCVCEGQPLVSLSHTQIYPTQRDTYAVSLPFKFSDQNYLRISLFSHACHVSGSLILLWSENLSIIWSRKQITWLLVLIFLRFLFSLSF